jgi:hypothetical protein
VLIGGEMMLIGGNPCYECGGEYGEHSEGCSVKTERDKEERERSARGFPEFDRDRPEKWAAEVEKRIVALEKKS